MKTGMFNRVGYGIDAQTKNETGAKPMVGRLFVCGRNMFGLKKQ